MLLSNFHDYVDTMQRLLYHLMISQYLQGAVLLQPLRPTTGVLFTTLYHANRDK